MCLLVKSHKPSKKPYRYKILSKHGTNPFLSIYKFAYWHNNKLEATDNYYPKRKVMKAPIGEKQDLGIHVFVNLKDAIKCLQYSPAYNDLYVVRLKVSGFLAAGEHCNYSSWGDGLKGECWKKAEIVKVLKVKVKA